MELLTEKHAEGFCLVYPGTLLTVTDGEPHRRATLYFSTRKAAEEYRAKIHKAAEILARAGYPADTQEYIIRAMFAGSVDHIRQAAACWLNKDEDSPAAAELAEAIHAAHPGGSIWDREELEEAIAA